MRYFGDGDAASGSFDPGDPGGNPMAAVSFPTGDINDLIAAQNAQNSARRNVDPITASLSRLKGGSLTTFATVFGGAVLLALALSSPSGGRR